jgi:hypothetical protein
LAKIDQQTAEVGLGKATLVPESKTSSEEDRMFRNHKELVIFRKIQDLFKELSSLDNAVEGIFLQIAKFHFNIKH